MNTQGKPPFLQDIGKSVPLQKTTGGFIRYRAILFDLCDTIMPFRYDRMPLARIHGKEIRTTSPLLYTCFMEYYNHIPYEEFHDHFVDTTETTVALRTSKGQEVSSAARFELFMDRLGIKRSDHWSEIHRKFIETHLSRIATCLELSPSYRNLLVSLKRKYYIGMISNFDDAGTVYRILEREGIRHLFGTVIVSEEMGIRKPRPEVFLAACQRLFVSPEEVLFVGDSLENDVGGAKGVGMDTVWVNPAGLVPSEGGPRPDYILSDLTELTQIL